MSKEEIKTQSSGHSQSFVSVGSSFPGSEPFEGSIPEKTPKIILEGIDRGIGFGEGTATVFPVLNDWKTDAGEDMVLRKRKTEDTRKHARRKNNVVNETDITANLKRLSPMYRQRIFFDQLKRGWYLVLLAVVLVSGISVAISILFFSNLPRQIIEVYPTKTTLYGTWGVIRFGKMTSSVMAERIRANDTDFINSAQEDIKNVYLQADVPVENVLLFFFDSSNSDSAPSSTNKQTVVIEHSVFLNENETILPEEFRTGKLIRAVRRILNNNSIWMVDANLILLRLGSISSRARSVDNFLHDDFPGLDLQMRRGRSIEMITLESCSVLKAVDGGEMTPDDCTRRGNIYSGLTCTVTCNKEYILTGSVKRTCLSSNIWSGEQTRCERFCNHLIEIKNGMILPQKCVGELKDNSSIPLFPGSICLHFCSQGFRLVGSFRRTCNVDGSWSSTTPVCKRTCHGRMPPAGGHVVPFSCTAGLVMDGSICAYYCDENYILQGELTATCLSDGRWTADVPICRKMCNELKKLENGMVHPEICVRDRVFEGTRCIFKCNDGYVLVGSSARSCNITNEWSGEETRCVRSCPKLSHDNNLIISPLTCSQKHSLVGQICEFSCENGFSIRGPEKVECRNDGKWSKVSPACIAFCIEHVKPQNGELVCSGLAEGSTCALLCPEGYILFGSGSVTCKSDGSWSEPIGICRNTCPKYKSPEHGKMIPANCAYELSVAGKECYFQCDIGYGISGDMSVQCLHTGLWSSNSTECIKEDQYILQIDTSELKMCLILNFETFVIEKEEWVNCIPAVRYARWSIYTNRLLRNSDIGLCLAVTEPIAMSDLTVKPCDLSDPQQVWDWPLLASASYFIKLRSYNIYPWEGYPGISKIVTVDHTSPLQSNWVLFNVVKRTYSSVTGAFSGGRCPSLENGENGRWSPSTCTDSLTTSSTYCIYVCKPGYKVSKGEVEIKCKNGMWSKTEKLRCVRSCKGLNIPYNGNLMITPAHCMDEFVDVATMCTASCRNGVLTGEKYLFCLDSETWSFSLPACQHTCPPLFVNGSGNVLKSDECVLTNEFYREGSICMVECDEGSMLMTSPIYTCIGDSWDEDSPVCKRTCPPLGHIEDGHIECVSGDDLLYVEGEVCKFTCDPGSSFFSHFGESASEVTCLSSGMWSDILPICMKRCPGLVPNNHLIISPSHCTNTSVGPGTYCHQSCDSESSTLTTIKYTYCYNGGWSNGLIPCKEVQPFIIWQQVNEEKVCLSATKTLKLVYKYFPSCNISDPNDLWFIDGTNWIKHVRSHTCIGVQSFKDTAKGYLQSCTVEYTMIDISRNYWNGELRHGRYMLKITVNDLFLTSGMNESKHLEIDKLRPDLPLAKIEWKALDKHGNVGSVFGITKGKCPKLVMPQNVTISPHVCTLSYVDVGINCTIKCVTGTRVHTFECLEYGVWSKNTISCEHESCPPLIPQPHSYIIDISCTSENSEINKVCKIECQSGYISGDYFHAFATIDMRCMHDGEWNRGIPECKRNCTRLLPPPNGKMFCMSLTNIHGSICSFSCNANFEASGALILTCQDGVWDPTGPPTCLSLPIKQHCQGLPSGHAVYKPEECNLGEVSIGTECRISQCNTNGLWPSHSSTICQNNEEWYGSVPQCYERCEPYEPSNDVIYESECFRSNITHGDICHFTCPKNYLSVTPFGMVTCRYGNWNIEGVLCEELNLFNVKSVATDLCIDWTLEGIKLRHCDSERLRQTWLITNTKYFQLKSAHVRQFCLSLQYRNMVWEYDNFWSIPVDMRVCNGDDPRQLWHCPLTKGREHEVHNKLFNLKLSSINSTGELIAIKIKNEDLRLTPPSLFYPVHDGITQDKTLCGNKEFFTCPDIAGQILNISLGGDQCAFTSEYRPGMTCELECVAKETLILSGINKQFVLDGPKRITCQSNGLWNWDKVPSCKSNCEQLVVYDHASVSPSTCTDQNPGPLMGDICTFKCDEGFDLLEGYFVTKCLGDLKYSNYSPVCFKRCPPLGYMYSARILPSSCTTDFQNPMTRCTTQCNDGYELEGLEHQTCWRDGSWSPQGTCHRICPLLSPITHGVSIPSDCSTSYKKAGSECYFKCDDGYALNNQARICGNNGLWSGKESSCLRKCPVLEPPTNGFFITPEGTDIHNLEGTKMITSCIVDFAVDNDPFRVCLPSGEWTGVKSHCIPEKQFQLIQSSPPNPTICIFTDHNLAIKMSDFSECKMNSPWHRWAWHGKNTIRNVGTNKCLSASVTAPERYLILVDCNLEDPLQIWSCSATNQNSFTITQAQLIPVYSALSTSRVLLLSQTVINFVASKGIAPIGLLRWFAKTTEANQTSLCAAKQVETCPRLELGFALSATPAACQESKIPTGTDCVFECLSGNVMKNAIASTTCLISGYWSDSVPTCVASCEPLLIGKRLGVFPASCTLSQKLPEGKRCQYSCTHPYYMVGQSINTCMSNGSWSSPPPECKMTCPALNVPMKGSIEPKDCSEIGELVIEGTVCKYQCLLQEHALSKSITRVCKEDGTWSGYESKCIKPCYPLKELANAIASPIVCTEQTSLIGTICSFHCAEGFLPLDPYYRTCLENGTWTGTELDCQLPCLTIGFIDANAVIFPSTCSQISSIPGDTCGMKCNSGYDIIGNKLITCKSDGQWTGELGTCARKCPKLNKPKDGDMHPTTCLGGDIYDGLTCVPSCHGGHILQGSTFRTCVDGMWTGVPAQCLPSCPALSAIAFATVFPSTCTKYPQPVHSNCTVKCLNQTSTLNGMSEVYLTCLVSGFWDKAIPAKCVKTCLNDTVSNARVQFFGVDGQITEVLTEKSKCSVECDPYHGPSSHTVSSCVDGDWSPPLTTCFYIPYPVFIVQRIGFNTECIGVQGFTVIMYSWANCSERESGTSWTWRNHNMLVNLLTGLCMASAGPNVDQPLVISPCDNQDPLQQWDCDANEPYHLLLIGTNLGPSKRYKEVQDLSLQELEVPTSLFYTFNPDSESELGTICSRRPGPGCSKLVLAKNTLASPVECNQIIVPFGITCRLSCLFSKYNFTGDDELRCDESGLWIPEYPGTCNPLCPRLVPPDDVVFFRDEKCISGSSSFRTVCEYACPSGYVLSHSNSERKCLNDGLWSPGSGVKCNALCPTITKPKNANIHPSPCDTGTCTIECDVGYRLDGPKVRFCQSFGEWSGVEFSCIEDVQFSIRANIAPLRMSMCLTVQGNNVIVKEPCVDGSKSQSWRWSSHFTLQHVGSGNCLAVRSLMVKGRYTNDTDENSDLDTTQTYDFSYFRNSSLVSDVHSIQCNATSSMQRWECDTSSYRNHFRIRNIKHDTFLDSGPQFTTRVTLTVTSSRSSRWFIRDHAGVSTVCSRRPTGVCSPLSLLHGGSISPKFCLSQFITPGIKCFFSCDQAYIMEGAKSITCGANGLWTDEKPFCYGLNKCLPLKVSRRVKVVPPSCTEAFVPEGKSCRFKCSKIEVLIGDESMTCTENRVWVGSVPTCNITCSALPAPINGYIYPESCQNREIFFGMNCSFQCYAGYDIVGPSFRLCKADGRWSDKNAVCRKLCPALTAPAHSLVEPEDCLWRKSASGNTCKITCLSGYQIVGESRLVCSDGMWSAPVPSCDQDACPRYYSGVDGIESVIYKNIRNDAVVKNSIMNIECRTGYLLIGTDRRICLNNGSWSGPEEICRESRCHPLLRLYHGEITPTACLSVDRVPVGTLCIFSCDDGYISSGPTYTECLSFGRWSVEDLPQCFDTNQYAHSIYFIISTSPYKDEWSSEGGFSSSLSTNGSSSKHLCINSDRDSKDAMLTDCYPVSPFKLWRWFGSSRLQNVANHLCWELNHENNLTVDKCDLNSTRQVVKCDNVNSPSDRLLLSIHGKYLTHTLRVTTMDIAKNLNWVAASTENNLQRMNLQSLDELLYEDDIPVCTYMCGGNLTADEGDFSTPNFPENYPRDVTCKWTLLMPHKVLYVDFSTVMLSARNGKRKKDEPCLVDYLLIFEGRNGKSEISDMLMTICETKVNFRVKSLHGMLHIELHSDHFENDNQQGFAARWYTEERPPIQSECGISDLKVRRNHNTTTIHYPWHVAIKTGKRLCDGTLIDKKFVLTSAFCVEHIHDENSIISLVVAYDFSSQSELVLKLGKREFDFAEKLWIHPSYDGYMLKNNVALIMLAEGISENRDLLHPICLPSVVEGRIERAGQWCVIAGYSSTLITHRSPTWRFTNVERVHILTRDVCHDLMTKEHGLLLDKKSWICTEAFYDADKKSPILFENTYIDNDGGSILQCEWNENWYAIGLSNFIMEDDTTGKRIRVFTNVNNQMKWIQKALDNAYIDPSNVYSKTNY